MLDFFCTDEENSDTNMDSLCSKHKTCKQSIDAGIVNLNVKMTDFMFTYKQQESCKVCKGYL